MIALLRGQVDSVFFNTVIIDCNDVGYTVVIAETFAKKLKEGDHILLYIHQIFREDSHTLYGFERSQQKYFFQDLLTVKKVGPSAAMRLLSAFNVAQLCSDIESCFPDHMLSVHGIGETSVNNIFDQLKNKTKKYLLEMDND